MPRIQRHQDKPLEFKPPDELDNALSTAARKRRGNTPKGRATNVITGIEEIRTVQDVESFSAKLEVSLFRDADVFDDRRVPVKEERSVVEIAGHVARLTGAVQEENLSWERSRAKRRGADACIQTRNARGANALLAFRQVNVDYRRVDTKHAARRLEDAQERLKLRQREVGLRRLPARAAGAIERASIVSD